MVTMLVEREQNLIGETTTLCRCLETFHILDHMLTGIMVTNICCDRNQDADVFAKVAPIDVVYH